MEQTNESSSSGQSDGSNLYKKQCFVRSALMRTDEASGSRVDELESRKHKVELPRAQFHDLLRHVSLKVTNKTRTDYRVIANPM